MNIVLKETENIKVERKDGIVIKSAKNKPYAKRLFNEYAVYKAITEQSSFKMPEVHHFSSDENSGTLIREWVSGEELGDEYIAHDSYQMHIPEIAEKMVSLRNAKMKVLPLDSIVNGVRPGRLFPKGTHSLIWKHLRAPQLAAQSGYDCSSLLEKVKGSDMSRTAFNHFDLVPRHIIVRNGSLYLIDSENASNNFPEHTDIALATSSLALEHNKPDLAKNLIAEYKKALEIAEPDAVNYFNNTIKGLLAFRAIDILRQKRKHNEKVSDKSYDYIKSLE